MRGLGSVEAAIARMKRDPASSPPRVARIPAAGGRTFMCLSVPIGRCAVPGQGRRLSPLLLLVPGVLGLLGVVYHEWWRDEAYIWLVVRSSGSVGELVQSLGFNGHPWAYYVLAWGLYHLVASPLVLSLTNLALSLAAP